MKKDYKYIELFAGCGGLSLGLESCGWNLELANELSPMAADTFAFNLLAADIKDCYKQGSPVCYVEDISKKDDFSWSNKKLVIGNVVELVKKIEDIPELQTRFKNIDLISGGPPCQGFSMAGKRKERDPKNKLPYAFVDLVRIVQPKTVLLENVEGILRPFKSDGGVKKPWLELAKAFASVGYAPICFMVNAKYFGIPQNRPRFILIGVRKDLEANVMHKLQNANSTHSRSEYQNGFKLANAPKKFISEFTGNQEGIRLNVIDMTKFKTDGELEDHFSLNLLYPPAEKKPYKTVKDAIHDLRHSGITVPKGYNCHAKPTKGTPYSQLLSKYFDQVIMHPTKLATGLYNHELRKHSDKIKLRFYLIQEAAKRQNGERKLLEDAIKGKQEPFEAANRLWNIFNRKVMMKQFRISSSTVLAEKIIEVHSKKHIQRPLNEMAPAPSQVTIPDDLCHYDSTQQRVLTVREMARIQSFPDEFVFRSKATTGGQNRKNEVPQYTQVGNAVPPLLARSIGILVKNILK